MTNYKHGNWYCKPKTEEEAKEIVERAVASGAVLYDSLGLDSNKNQYAWSGYAAWGVREGRTFTDNVECSYNSVFAAAQKLTIEQVRERFPLPKKVDWSTAPHDAQFFSCKRFRKYEGNIAHRWYGGKRSDSLEWHKKQPDFEFRPESVQPDAVQNETKYTHYTSARNGELHVYTKCVIVSPTKDKHGNIVVLNEFGFYKTVPQNEVHPLRTKRDKWVEAAIITAPHDDSGLLRGFAESIYELMKNGTLEKPE